jgi:hypothetical protein
MCDKVTGIYPLSFWPGVGIYFLIDIRGWVKHFFDFLMVVSAIFLPKTIFFCPNSLP